MLNDPNQSAATLVEKSSYEENSDSEKLIGAAAKNQAAVNPENAIFFGRKFEDKEVQKDRKLVHSKVVRSVVHQPVGIPRDAEITEKPIEPIKVYSEKELIREFEKIAATLVPEKDWSMRISAMRRVEGLVAGGATDYSCFRGLLKQLVGPLNTQLADRRSTIVKQVGDFEACAEMFIPEMYMQGGSQFREELQRHHLPSYMVKDINARLERIEPQQRSTDSRSGHHVVNEVKTSSVNPKKSSPRAKAPTRENSLFGGEADITEKPIEPIKVYSEKELIREFEKIAATSVA